MKSGFMFTPREEVASYNGEKQESGGIILIITISTMHR